MSGIEPRTSCLMPVSLAKRQLFGQFHTQTFLCLQPNDLYIYLQHKEVDHQNYVKVEPELFFTTVVRHPNDQELWVLGLPLMMNKYTHCAYTELKT